jgi:hypothetical protein
MKLIEQLQHSKEEQRQSALVRYYRMTNEIDVNNPTDEDRTTLEEMLSAAGKSLDDFVRDRATVQGVVSKIGQVIDTAKASDGQGKAYEQYLAACAERQRIWKEQNEKVTAAKMRADQLAHDQHLHNSGKKALRELRESNPPLYAAIIEPNEKRLGL